MSQEQKEILKQIGFSYHPDGFYELYDTDDCSNYEMIIEVGNAFKWKRYHYDTANGQIGEWSLIADYIATNFDALLDYIEIL